MDPLSLTPPPPPTQTLHQRNRYLSATATQKNSINNERQKNVTDILDTLTQLQSDAYPYSKGILIQRSPPRNTYTPHVPIVVPTPPRDILKHANWEGFKQALEHTHTLDLEGQLTHTPWYADIQTNRKTHTQNNSQNSLILHSCT